MIGTAELFTLDRLPMWGAGLFGAVVGWLANHVLQRVEKPDVAWLSSMIGVLGGGAVTALFEPRSLLFGAYCVGLGAAFFFRVVARPVTAWFGRVLAKTTDEVLQEDQKTK